MKKVFDEEKERVYNMADRVLVTSSAMQKTVTDFNNHVLDFDTATKNLTAAVDQLQATWKGVGYQTFASAMMTWNHHMNIVGSDLTIISDGVNKSDNSMQTIDADIARAYAPFANA